MRAYTVGVMALAVLLVSGAPTDRPVRSDGGEQARTEAPKPFVVEDLVRDLRKQGNAALTDGDLRRIASAILTSSARHDLDPRLVTAVMIVESGARPWARSQKGAVGLMQVMPHMATHFDVVGDLTRIESNVELGCLILADNIRRLGEEDGISSYFWGSRIRGGSYLKRVLEVRESLGEPPPSQLADRGNA